MKAIIFKTKPYSMFRLGAGSKDEVDLIIHSDTLFSAIISMHSQIFENTDEFVELFINDQIKISSAFPMLLNEEQKLKIMYLPKPELNYSYSEDIKAEKKIKFISYSIWEKLFINEGSNSLTFSDKEKYLFLNGSFVCLKDEIGLNKISMADSFLSKEIYAKTKVHSSTQEDSFYHETNIQLMPLKLQNGEMLNPQYYFLLEADCEKIFLDEFYTCLRVLADEGIGGERSTGKGHFDDIIIEDIVLPEILNPTQYFTLSLTNPLSQVEFDSFIRYDIITRGGGSISLDDDVETYAFDSKPYRKKQVRMIAEGALINNSINGRLVDISPDTNTANHKFYRNGKCFSLPIG